MHAIDMFFLTFLDFNVRVFILGYISLWYQLFKLSTYQFILFNLYNYVNM
jgi:hypothetical protein